MILKDLSNIELLRETKASVTQEKSATHKVLHYLREVESRRLHLERGFSSLHEFCMKELGYDEYESQKRVSAMRLLRELPQIESKIVSGELSLTALNKAKTVFNKIAKKGFQGTGEPLKAQDKMDILKTLENKSIRECDRELIKICPEALPKKLESQRLLTEELTELKVVLKKETLEKLTRLKELLSHQNSNMTTAELIDRLADEILQRTDPHKRQARPQKNRNEADKALKNALEQEKTVETKKSRYIPAKIRQEIWIRDQAQCSFTDPVTKRRCSSRFKLEIDHSHPFAMGGENTLDNLRIFCRAHNTLHAIKVYGEKKMTQFL